MTLAYQFADQAWDMAFGLLWAAGTLLIIRLFGYRRPER